MTIPFKKFNVFFFSLFLVRKRIINDASMVVFLFLLSKTNKTLYLSDSEQTGDSSNNIRGGGCEGEGLLFTLTHPQDSTWC